MQLNSTTGSWEQWAIEAEAEAQAAITSAFDALEHYIIEQCRQSSKRRPKTRSRRRFIGGGTRQFTRLDDAMIVWSELEIIHVRVVRKEGRAQEAGVALFIDATVSIPSRRKNLETLPNAHRWFITVGASGGHLRSPWEITQWQNNCTILGEDRRRVDQPPYGPESERIQGLTWDVKDLARCDFTTDELWPELFGYIEQCRQKEAVSYYDYFTGRAERDG